MNVSILCVICVFVYESDFLSVIMIMSMHSIQGLSPVAHLLITMHQYERPYLIIFSCYTRIKKIDRGMGGWGTVFGCLDFFINLTRALINRLNMTTITYLPFDSHTNKRCT